MLYLAFRIYKIFKWWRAAKFADQFCSWTESLQKGDSVDLDEVLILLSEIFNRALLLPIHDSEEIDNKPFVGQKWHRALKFGGFFGIIGAILVAALIPKEQNNELKFWMGGFLSGAGATFFSFGCIHLIKISRLNKIE